MKKALALLITVSLFGIALLPLTVHSEAEPAALSSSDEDDEFVPDELLIKFRSGATEGEKADARRWLGALRKQEVDDDDGDGEIELDAIPTGLTVDTAIAIVESHPAVVYAERNWVYRHQAVSNDPLYTNGSLWGMYGDTTTPANQFGSQAGEAWAANNTVSASVYVGVIDEGIDLNHPDLAPNIWTNPFDPEDGVDNDRNGRIDDIHGWDFFENNKSIYDGQPGDNNTDSHGTHVSGTIGAVGGNAQGVAGVNWNVRIISGKFLGSNGGTTANAISAVNYFTDLKTRHGLNIVATSNSWGGGGYSQGLHDAIIRGAKAGILFIAAAGNGDTLGRGLNNDANPHYPANYTTATGTSTEPAANYDAVISVASITSTGARSDFSNYGATTVDLGAPGSAIWSTTPNKTYSSFSGTSMATPHVSGAAALYRSLNAVGPDPQASALAVKNAILGSARSTPTASLSGATPTVTGGRLNIGIFAGGPPPAPTPPSAPTNLTATAVSTSQINLSWADNSTNEDGFRIERCQGPGCTTFTLLAQTAANVVTVSNTGLAASTSYSYRVQAFNAVGSSASSNTASATTQAPPTVPASPSAHTATAVSSTQINLAWADNSGNEDGFKIERCQSAGCINFVEIAQTAANATSFNNTGLAAGTTYTYRVRAFNVAGNSGYSNSAQAATQAAPAIPPAPSNLTATAVSDRQVNLSWTDNSSNESGFGIERCKGATCTGFKQIASVGANVTRFSNTGLGNDTTYRYRVRAFNGVGNSAYSNTASARTLVAID